MKILHVTTYLSYGAGKAAIRLHEGLLDQGVNSHILCLYSDSMPVRNSHLMIQKSYFIRFLEKFRIRKSKERENMSYIMGQEESYETFTFCGSSYDITKHPEYRKADIINLHWTGFFLDYPSFFSKNIKPIVWSLSDMNPFTGGCHYSNGCEKFINENCKNCQQLSGTKNLNQSEINLIEKQSSLLKLKSLITIVTPANWLYELSRSSLLFKKYKHLIIPHASDESIYKPLDKNFCRQIFNLPEDKIVLLFSSGSLKSIRKGFSDLLEAINILKNPNIHLLIIGNLDIEISLSKSLYTVIGYVNDEEKMNIAYNSASVVVIPSAEDNLPLTLIDSMMCGTPSISYNIGGMREHIIDEINGIKAKELGSVSLSIAISDFIDHECKFDRDIIRKMALLKYSKPLHAKKYIDLYKEMLIQRCDNK